MEKVKNLSSLQVALLVISARLITVYAYMPITNTPPANQDMWIAAALSGVYVIIIFAPILYLSSKFPDMTPVEYSEKILGRVLGKFVGMLFVLFMAFISLMEIIMMADFLGSAIMPETPVYVTAFLMLVSCTYAIYKGIEAIGRAAEFFVPYIIFTVILFVLLSIKDMDFNVFLPVLADSTIPQINFAAFNTAERFYSVLILCMAVPNLKDKASLNKIFFSSVIITTLLSAVITLAVYAVLGVKQAEHANYPFFTFTRQINVFDFIQRIEAITVVAWVIGTFIKYSTYIYYASTGMAAITGVKSNRYFIIPISAILFAITIYSKLIKSVVASDILSYKILPNISFVFETIIPLILLIVYFFRRKSLTGAGK